MEVEQGRREKPRLRFILLTDCRCGSTALRGKLIQAGLNMPDKEVLLEPWLDRRLDPWEQVCGDGAHVHRYQLEELRLWRHFMRMKPSVIHLTRLDLLAQYTSWRVAMNTGIWHGHDRKRPGEFEFDEDEYSRMARDWLHLREKGLRLFADCPSLRVTYEAFERDADSVVATCLDFLRIA